MFELNDIRKSYGKRHVLTGVSLVVAPGQAVAVAGRNGSGKSTLLAIAAGALKADGGAALFDGRDTRRAGAAVAFLPQSDALFEDLTTRDNLAFWAAAHKVKLKRLEDDPAVRLMELAEYAKTPVRKLSGGTKRRLSICTRLLANPAVILLDEPFAGLDMFYKQELIGYLAKLKAMGKAILFTSHGADEIAALADSLALLDGGRVAMTMDAGGIRACGLGLAEELTRMMGGGGA